MSDSSMHVKRFFLVSFLILSYFLSIDPVFATSDSTTLTFSESSTQTIGTWEPWLTGLRIELSTTLVIEGSSTITWSVNKDFISSGESVNLNLGLTSANYDPSLLIHVKIIKKSNSATLVDKTLELPFPSTPLPGSLYSPKISVPIIPFELIGVPAELSLQAQLYLDSDFLINLVTYGVDPSQKSFIYSSSTSKEERFIKNTGVGAAFTISRTGISLEGSILISAGITIASLPTPLSYSFSSVPISWGNLFFQQSYELCKLSTPIELQISSNKDVINKGEPLIITGSSNPLLTTASLDLYCNNINQKSFTTNQNGVYSVEWSSSRSGIYSFYVIAQDSEYVQESISDSISIRVNEAPMASFDVSKTRAKVNVEIDFTDASYDPDGNIVSWQWNFGDSRTSNERNPNHSYGSSGTYDIILLVRDNDGAESEYVYESLKIEKKDIDLDISLSDGSVDQGDSVTISGSTYPEISGVEVEIAITKPDNSKESITTLLNQGYYERNFEVDEEGEWKFQAILNGNNEYNDATSESVRLVVNKVIAQSQTSDERTLEQSKVPGIPGFPIVSIVMGLVLTLIFLLKSRVGELVT